MKHEETARRLRLALSDAGISQQELADRAGISKTSVSQYVHGTHIPGNGKAGAMAEVLNCNPLWLMGFDVTRERPKKVNKDIFRRYVDLLATMSEEEQEDAMDYLRYIIAKRKK